MTKLRHLLAAEHPQIAVVAALIFATVVCMATLAARAIYARRLADSGLLWNLFLAWLPMLAALVVHNLKKRAVRGGGLLIVPIAFLWLLFFPNAPYILTNILRLSYRYGAPLWYDLIMLVAFAWTGTFLGLTSLYLMQSLVRRSAGTAAGWLFTLTVLALTGFGVYLGRFSRWNSWDLFLDPARLLADIWERVADPLAHTQTFVFSALFSLCVTAMYLILVALIGFRSETHEQ